MIDLDRVARSRPVILDEIKAVILDPKRSRNHLPPCGDRPKSDGPCGPERLGAEKAQAPTPARTDIVPENRDIVPKRVDIVPKER
jgi:hypothetical protein